MASFTNRSGKPVLIRPENEGEKISIWVPDGATYYGNEYHGYGIDGVWIDGRWYQVPDGSDVVLTENKIECWGGRFGWWWGKIVGWLEGGSLGGLWGGIAGWLEGGSLGRPGRQLAGLMEKTYGFQDGNPLGWESPEDKGHSKREALPEELTPPQEPEQPEQPELPEPIEYYLNFLTCPNIQ